MIEVNELQKRRVIGKLKKHLGTLEGKRVALLGLAFKPETDDMREASSLVLGARLLAEGAEVCAYDPVVEDGRTGCTAWRCAASAEEAVTGADAAVLVTEWDSIVDLDWAAAAPTMRSPVVIDGRNALDPEVDDRPRVHVRGHRAHPGPRARRPAAAGRLMQAVILVGGEGRRLRPLTDTRPKPMMPLVDRPFVAHQLDHLRRHGITDVVFSCGYRPDALEAHFGDGSAMGMRVRYVVDPEPLGTAGAIKNAQDLLDGDAVLVLNGDILTDLDLGAMIARHRETGAVGTLALTPVDDPSAFGLVRLHDDCSVEAFVEKPSREELRPGEPFRINAGTYLLEPVGRRPHPRRAAPARSSARSSRSSPPAGACSASRATPTGATSGPPPRTWRPHHDVLSGAVVTESPTGAAYLGPGARIGSGASVDPLSSLGAGADVGIPATVAGSVVGEEAHIGDGAALIDAILGAGVRVGAGARIGEGAVVGRRRQHRRPASGGRLGAHPDRRERRVASRPCSDSTDPTPTRATASACWACLAESVAAFDEARAAAEAVELIFPAEEVHDVAVCGMGGSAISADLLLGAYRERVRVPMTVVRDYYLPGWIGENTLVILSSYSGGHRGDAHVRLAGHGAQRALRGDHERRQARLVLRRRGRAGRPGAARLPAPGGAAPHPHADRRAARPHGGRPAARGGPRRGAHDAGERDPHARPRRSRGGESRQAARPLAGGRHPHALGRGADGAGRHPLEGPDQRERQAPGDGLGAARARPQRDRRVRRHAGRAAEAERARDAARPAPAPPGAAALRPHPRAGGDARRPGAVDHRRGGDPLARTLDLVILGDYASIYLALLRGVDPGPVDVIERLKGRLAETGYGRAQAQ